MQRAAPSHLSLAVLILMTPLTVRGAPALTQTAAGLLREGKVNQALATFERAAREDPEDAAAWFGVASARFDIGRLGAAEAAIQRALAIDPDLPEAWILAGCIAQDRGHYREAKERYQRYLAANPMGPQADELREVIRQLPDGDRETGTR